MSNLSDLIPAGASGKTIEAVATANITSKAPVILNSAGTVTQVAETTVAAALGSSAEFVALRVYDVCSAYDTVNDKFVIVYRKATALTWNAVVATVSGSSISYGTPVEINATASSGAGIAYDVSAGKMVVVFHDSVGANYGRSAVGTVSGTSISFATIVVFNSAAITNIGGLVYDANVQKVVVIYSDDGTSIGYSRVGTISGTLSWGAAASFSGNSITMYAHSLAYDSTANKVVISYRDQATGDYGYSVVGTVSGTTISFGTPVAFESAITSAAVCSYDPVQDKTVIAYRDHGDTDNGKGIVGTVSGTSISFGTAATFSTGVAASIDATYDLTASKTVIVFRDTLPTTPISYMTSASLSGTTLTFDSNLSIAKDTSNNSCTYDPDNGKVLVAYLDDSDDGSGETGDAQMFTTGADISNLTATNFVGIADAAISSSATGTIVVQGGTATGVSLDPYFSLGTPVVYETATTYYTASTYDSTNDKTVICYRDNGNGGAGTAIVGTVSGTTISYGTAVVFDSGSTNQMSATFDTNSGKIVIVYEDADASQQGTAVVGTVSGTSISFGTPVVFKGSETGGPPVVTYDSTAQKVVVVYNVNSTTNKGHAIVGTVSGTSISFGTEVIFKNDIYNSQFGVAYDANADRTVITYQKNGGNGTAIVGTVSGTGISFGTEVVYNSADSTGNNAVYDPDSQKVVIAFVTVGVGKGVVGTVSGTGISFGALATFAASDVAGGLTNSNPIAYDTAQDKVVLVYEDTTANTLYANTGTVSGTSISFGTATTLTTNNTGYAVVSYDPDVQRSVFAYADGGSSDHGTAIVGTLGTDLATGSKYYVTTTGGYSTSAGSPSVSAGLAISTTSLLLNGDS